MFHFRQYAVNYGFSTIAVVCDYMLASTLGCLRVQLSALPAARAIHRLTFRQRNTRYDRFIDQSSYRRWPLY